MHQTVLPSQVLERYVKNSLVFFFQEKTANFGKPSEIVSIICQMTSDLSSGKFFNTVTDADRRKWVKKLATKDGLVGVMSLGPPTEFLNPLLTKK